MLKIVTDRDACIGSENCRRFAPTTFATDDEGKVVVLDASTDTDQAIRHAVEGCPMAALRIAE